MWKSLAITCLLLLALALGVVASMREDASEELEKALGDAELEALLAEAPPLDRALQERLWCWMLDKEGWPGGWSTDLDEDWYLAGERQPPVRVLEEHERLRDGMAELSGILATDHACMTSLGWLEQVVRQSSRRAFSDFALRFPANAKTAAAARWYAHAAMSASAPRKALDNLERLHHALSPGGTVVCRMQARTAARIRDRTYLRLMLRGRAPGGALWIWLSERTDEVGRLAQEVRLDRVLYGNSVGQDVLSARYLDLDADIEIDDRLHWWWQGAGDVASWLTLCRTFERYLRGLSPAAEVQRFEELRRARLGRPFVTDRYHSAILESAVLGNAAHRLARVVAHVLRFKDETGHLPRDADELRSWLGAAATLLDHGPFELALVYDTPGRDRFRVCVDPNTPVPELLNAEARERIRAADESDGYQYKSVLRWVRPHNIEVRIPDS